MSAFAELKDAWSDRGKWGDSNRTRELAAFLPASLEIQESPPNPLARWLAWGLLILVMSIITWALLGRVNIVASAEGKIIPSSRVKQVQPFEKGVIKTLFVSEGEYVNQGQPLIELDTTLTLADKTSLESELQSANLRLAVMLGVLALLEKSDQDIDLSDINSSALDIPSGTSPQAALFHNNLRQQQWFQYKSQLEILRSSFKKIQAEQGATSEVIKKLEQTLPIVEKRSSNLKKLLNKNYVSENDYLAAEQERIQQSHDLAAERQRLKLLQESASEVLEQINLHKSQSIGNLLTEITELQQRLTILKEDFTKASDLNAKQVLYSPVAGRVQELAVNTTGGVVTEAQQLMLVVPDDNELEVEAFLENKDIGFVNEGMPAEVKIHTFPFTKYGVIDAVLTNVSDDATVDEERGAIYRMQLRMVKKTLSVEGKEVQLQPGMTVTVEVQTGDRRIIEFFLAPLLRHKNESIHER